MTTMKIDLSDQQAAALSAQAAARGPTLEDWIQKIATNTPARVGHPPTKVIVEPQGSRRVSETITQTQDEVSAISNADAVKAMSFGLSSAASGRV